MTNFIIRYILKLAYWRRVYEVFSCNFSVSVGGGLGTCYIPCKCGRPVGRGGRQIAVALFSDRWKFFGAPPVFILFFEFLNQFCYFSNYFGRVREWFNRTAWKAVLVLRARGFKSHPFRRLKLPNPKGGRSPAPSARVWAKEPVAPRRIGTGREFQNGRICHEPAGSFRFFVQMI